MHEASGRNILSSQVWLVTTSGPYRKAAHDQKPRIRIRNWILPGSPSDTCIPWNGQILIHIRLPQVPEFTFTPLRSHSPGVRIPCVAPSWFQGSREIQIKQLQGHGKTVLLPISFLFSFNQNSDWDFPRILNSSPVPGRPILPASSRS